MKWWMWSVAYSLMIFSVEGREYRIVNEAGDSFSVLVVTNDPRVTITCLTPPVCRGIHIDPDKISGRIEWSCGKGGVPRKKQYDVVFEDGYVPRPGNEPFISFINEKGEFRLVFFDENYAELRSDMASEIHDDPKRREYDHDHPYIKGKSYRREDEYDGFVRHWIVFGSYAAAYCYEMYNFPMRGIDIFEALDDNSWISSIREVDFDSYVGINTTHRYPPQPERHWWQGLCCCTNCD